MQSIKHHTMNIHPIMDDIEALYSMISDKDEIKEHLINPTLDNSLSSILRLIDKYAEIKYDIRMTDKHYRRMEVNGIEDKAVVICFSGGKDCTATILRYKELGYKIYLYHLKGFKWAYPVDYRYAQEVADYLGLPMHIEEVKMIGRHKWQIDHPMSRMILLNRALSYAISNKLAYKVATGDFLTSTLDDVPFEINAADTITMNRCYEQIIKAFIPKFELLISNQNHYTAFEMIYERKDKELLRKIISCANIHKWRDYWGKRNSEKYHINLLPHRCGLCYKCCSEYIYFCDHDMMDFNKEYYQYCLKRLLRLWDTEFDKPLPKTINQFWDTWIFYDISKSKLYPDILNYRIRGRALMCKR